jgi:outer membrane protein OmpA-like peptidoglycan-associated protein
VAGVRVEVRAHGSGNVNTKVDTLSGSSRNAGAHAQERGADWHGGHEGGSRRPVGAGSRGAADAAAQSARQVNTRVDQVQTELNTAVASSRKLVYEVTLSEDQGQFKSGKFELPDTAKARLDEVIGQLKSDTKNVFIEIEGHTDNVGDKTFNESLGMERAEAVKRYLYEQHQIPLHKMNVISYGEEKPSRRTPTARAARRTRRREGSVVSKVSRVSVEGVFRPLARAYSDSRLGICTRDFPSS